MNQTNKIVIVGAGAAGLACAISAANQGAKVTLVEKTASLGGTVVHSLIHTIGGLYDDRGDYINGGVPVQLATLLLEADPQTRKRQMGKVWTLSVDPAVYERIIEQWIDVYPNITVLRNTYPTQVHVKEQAENGSSKKQITQIELAINPTGDTEIGCGPRQLLVDVLVDTTGGAEVVRMVDPSKVVAGDALAGLIFQIRGVAPNALNFPKNVGIQRNAQKAVELGYLPSVFAKTWFDIGVYEDEVYAKASMLTSSYDAMVIPELAAKLTQFLQTQPDFARAHVTRIGRLGIRDNGRIKGDYCLTVADVKSGGRFADAIARCAWPIEYWDPNEGATLDYLPAGHSYEIPLRALKVAGMDNVWAAGKCISAEKRAQASVRVAGTCWAMGDALGQVIAEAL